MAHLDPRRDLERLHRVDPGEHAEVGSCSQLALKRLQMSGWTLGTWGTSIRPHAVRQCLLSKLND
jgi:hypothetical protein